MIVSLCVNNYMYVQGANSVTDQFFINQKDFSKNGVKIDSVCDYKHVFFKIPNRENLIREKKLKTFLKNTPLYDSFIAKLCIFYVRYWKVGKCASKVIKKHAIQTTQDIIIFEDVIAAYYYLKSKRSNTKIIFMTHSYDDELEMFFIAFKVLKNSFIEKIFRSVYRYVYLNANAVVTICSSAKESIYNRFGIMSHVIYNSLVDNSAIYTYRVQGKNKTSEMYEKIKIVVASSISYRKGSDMLCSCIEKLPDTYQKIVEFHIFGSGPFYEEFSSRMNGRNNVFLYGLVTSPFKMYDNMDVMLLPSRMETLPMTILEGMRAHLPVIATDVGATRELIDDGITGYLIQPTEESILNAVIRAVNEREKFFELGENGYQKYKTQFESGVWVSKFSSLFHELIEEYNP